MAGNIPPSLKFPEAISNFGPQHRTSAVGGAWGAAYALGTPICALVTGICCVLAFEYFQQFPKDGTRIRASVIVVIATTIFGLFLAMDLTYVRLVKNQTPPGGFGDIPWQDDAVALICGVCQLICSAYFAYSAYSVATRKKLLIIWYGLLMMAIFLGAFFRAIIGLAPTDWFDGAVLCPKMTFMWLIPSGSSTETENELPSPQPGVDPTNMPPTVIYRTRAPLLDRLLTTILTSFSLTAILMFSLLILVLAMHGTEFDPRLPKATGIFTALRLLATPTYAVTFLFTLNRRKYQGCRLTRSSTIEHVIGLAQLGPQTNAFGSSSNSNSQSIHMQPTFFTIFPANKGFQKRKKAILFGPRINSNFPAPVSLSAVRYQPSPRSRRVFPKETSNKDPQSDHRTPPATHVSDNQRQSIYRTSRPPSNRNEINFTCYPHPVGHQPFESTLLIPIYTGTSIQSFC